MGILTALRRRMLADLDSRLAPRFHETFNADPAVSYTHLTLPTIYSV